MNLIKAIILPPGINIIFMLIGILLWVRLHRQRAGSILFTIGMITLYLFTTPIVAEHLLAPLINVYPPLILANIKKANDREAIVVISSGQVYAPEYSGNTVSPESLTRIRYAATLWRTTKLPVLVSGGTDIKGRDAEATLMQHSLENDFQVPVRWVELRSENTYENAFYSKEILHNHGINKIYLVTNAWHMPRAMLAFKIVGINAIAAPTGYPNLPRGANILRLLPSAHSLRYSQIALYEYFGYLLYLVKYHQRT